MNFGVSGAIGACSSNIYRNPVTIAAVARQREKARLANDPTYRTHKEQLERIRAQVASDKVIREERFRREFLFDITKRRMMHEKDRLLDPKLRATPSTMRITARDVISYHAEQSGYSYESIIGPRRLIPLNKIRHQAMADVYVICAHLSLPRIGEAFGGRDHTTILHAVHKMGVHYSQTGIKRQDGNYISLREALAA